MLAEDGSAAVAAVRPRFLRRRDAAAVLAISESQLLAWERADLIRPVRLPGCRAVRYTVAAIDHLADQIASGALLDRPSENNEAA